MGSLPLAGRVGERGTTLVLSRFVSQPHAFEIATATLQSIISPGATLSPSLSRKGRGA